MSNKCPVCNKAGLPDFRTNLTICPQCNSDLKPFLLLHSLSKPMASKGNKLALIGVGLLAAVITVLYVNSVTKQKRSISENSRTLIQFQDSLKKLQETLAKPQLVPSEVKSSDNEIVIQYKVKNGDSPSKIAHFFYNDWSMYEKIEIDNNLKQPYILKVGQLLTIKLEKE
ncbi:hypothetical protein CAP36_07935 [Chitinophagaceae bacterium IBVUCB2]|nr:hypothetical protein CAP36_07935 [Chitinophagaceae bacterium IBVUCB2]